MIILLEGSWKGVGRELESSDVADQGATLGLLSFFEVHDTMRSHETAAILFHGTGLLSLGCATQGCATQGGATQGGATSGGATSGMASPSHFKPNRRRRGTESTEL